MAERTISSLVLSNLHPPDLGDYGAIATNPAGNAFSQSASLNLHFAPSISGGVPLRSVIRGAAVVLQFDILGTAPVQYQWRKDGVDLIGRTEATLNLGKVLLSDTGIYTLVARNAFGSSVSSSTVLRVEDVIFRLLGVKPGVDGNSYLTMQLPLGHRYRLQKSLDLKNWTDVADITPQQVPHETAVYTPPTQPRTFYRAYVIE